MFAYEKRLKVKDPNKVVLTGLPLHKGQIIKVVIMTKEDASEYDTKSVTADLKQGFKELISIQKGDLKPRDIREVLSEL